MSDVTKSNPTSPIESLPADLIAPLLSHCHSLDDLSAIIHASPILYHGFLAAKGTILLALLSRDVGPGIRDALALARIGKLNWCATGYYTEAERAIQLYAGLPPVTLAARGIATDLVVKMIQFNRTSQFFVDWFVSTKLSMLEDGMPAACYPITSPERHRISQALVRYQIMMNIHWVYDRESPRIKSVRRDFFALFQAWELQQIYEIHGFIYRLVGGIPRHANDDFTRYLQDIVFFRRVLLSKMKRHSDLESRLRAELRQDAANRIRRYGPYCNWFLGSHSFPSRSEVDPSAPPTIPAHVGIEEAKAITERDELYAREQKLPALTAGRRASDPPYAWVDAMRGLNCCRWGGDLIRVPRPEAAVEDWIHAEEKLTRWLVLGFMFWDERRIEAIKTQTSEVTGFETGWLLTIWDDMVRVRRVWSPRRSPVEWSADESE